MKIGLVWFRQDLRLTDNPAFIQACKQYEHVIPLYIYDKNTSSLGQAQNWWLHHSLIALAHTLKKEKGLLLVLRHGNPLDVLLELSRECNLGAVFWNRCYEPLAIARDKTIKSTLQSCGINVHSSNGSLFHEPWSIKTHQGDFYKVFTPYWKKCRQMLTAPFFVKNDTQPKPVQIPSDTIDSWRLLPKLNWASQFKTCWTPGENGAQHALQYFIKHHLREYKDNRDFPIQNATSRLSPHLHFGEISPWHILNSVQSTMLSNMCDIASAEHFLSELGWREFSVYLLYHFPELSTKNFRCLFDQYPWENNVDMLECWKKGLTGYPLIDAGMRELWATGYMHNRVRMITASFLTKHLLIDWRIGAAWFLDTLVDADLANNSASWQWVAGCGADAAPYFRIFNPTLQSQKFDSHGEYIRQWVPELTHVSNQFIHQPWLNPNCMMTYPPPIVDHNAARQRALALYSSLDKT